MSGIQLPIYQKQNIVLYEEGVMQQGYTMIVNEAFLTVFLNGLEIATLVCSPIAYRELAVGFLLSEGLLQDLGDIKKINCNDKEKWVRVETTAATTQKKGHQQQTAGYNVDKKGASPSGNDVDKLSPVESSAGFLADMVPRLIDLLEEKSSTFRLTGGVHGAALADSKNMFVMYEDIGRHNAVDRVLGYSFLNQINNADKILLLSGRVSSEILIKAVRRGVPLVVSRSAPTQLALELADRFGVTVIGFARGQKFNIYSHKEKIIY
ncbi:MAG: formate dehydrogenase accessory sulfurtransferase FdhD [Peptococcaceae bacterium]|nr:formate dehydrogenase accessory sulfurtransferase FdhD [Peptococcaceae bacterium]